MKTIIQHKMESTKNVEISTGDQVQKKIIPKTVETRVMLSNLAGSWRHKGEIS